MADRQGNPAIPVHRPCAVERWFELRWKDVGPASMQFQPPAVIVVLQEICQIAHDMEMGIDWIAHGENASRKVILFLVFPVCISEARGEWKVFAVSFHLRGSRLL